MKRKNKETLIQAIVDVLIANDFILLINFHGINAHNTLRLRNSIKDLATGGMLVVKNTLARLALERTSRFPYLLDRFSGPVAIIHSNNLVEVTKLIVNFINTDVNQKNLSIICGAYLNRLLTAEDVEKLAKLPTLNDLRIKIMCLLSYSIATRLVACLSLPYMRLMRVLDNYIHSKK
ncbi:50S ribosomal protein L10 [Wolbachia endosymbiont of Howardula sp.]|uniref:50S ribosomal protein L10 n=1 Tax=Wolbachia endosymbiont of Howardula sp. TaxID=2916816 RepID=UPI00217DA26F|nr:50S ribosomal protein L10 [Wolbachia endosymbiont of Howardula sp.]UWI82986.1 50S ribosomal protein L10 [Wolbachia endosymbiont of Howardula sp.]